MEVNYKSVVDSLSGSDIKIADHLSYLLQDLWELGGGTEGVIFLLDKNISTYVPSATVLDLCCGKGANIISIAKKYKCRGKGIDLFEPFIKVAGEFSIRKKVQHLVDFETMDITIAVQLFNNYDLVIYGGDTNVLGNETESLRKIIHCCKPDGYLIYESAKKSISDIYHPIQEADLKIIDQVVVSKEEIAEINKINNKKIKFRARELIEKYPDQKELFESYVKSQEQESIELENNLILIRSLLMRN